MHWRVPRVGQSRSVPRRSRRRMPRPSAGPAVSRPASRHERARSGRDFLRPHLHRIVAISVALRSAERSEVQRIVSRLDRISPDQIDRFEELCQEMSTVLERFKAQRQRELALLQEAFSYRVGEELEQFHQLKNPDFEGVGGIHTSNQLTRLSMSKCFQESQMTCTSCHDPHQNQRGDPRAFTAGCLSCHQPTHCGMSDRLGDRIADNCVDCHMPTGDNEGMTLQVSGGLFTVRMIDHFIRIDKRASEQYLAQ